jgi:hypothetical protein
MVEGGATAGVALSRPGPDPSFFGGFDANSSTTETLCKRRARFHRSFHSQPIMPAGS